MPPRHRGPAVVLLSWTAAALLPAVGRLPWPLLTRIGAGLGLLYYGLDPRRRRIGLENLTAAFPEMSPRRRAAVLRSAYAQIGSSALEFAALPRLGAERIRRMVRFQGLENLARARAEGHGVVVLNGHLGNWELYCHAAAVQGFPLHVVARRANVEVLHRYIVRCRETHGNRVIVRDRAMRRILRVLKEGGVVGVMCDQRASTSRGLQVDFLGRPAATEPAVARMILASGAVAVTALGRRNPDQTHTVEISPPLPRPPIRTEADALLELTRSYTSVLESFIRRHPEQWLWMHRRWFRRRDLP